MQKIIPWLTVALLTAAPTGCGSDGPKPECAMDTDCALGSLCVDEICAPGCTAEHGCPSPESCCMGACVDLDADLNNCKSCGNACMPAEICGPSDCVALTYDSLCVFSTIGALQGGLVEDDLAGLQARDALQTACSSAAFTVLNQGSDAVIDQTTGQPKTGSATLLTVWGGSFRRPVIGYFEDNDATPLVFQSTNGGARFVISDADSGVVYADEAFANVGASHDIFTLQFLYDEPSGSIILNGSGSRGSGTLASAVFLEISVVPGIGMDPNAWYVVDWTDDDGVMGPSAGDTFVVLASG